MSARGKTLLGLVLLSVAGIAAYVGSNIVTQARARWLNPSAAQVQLQGELLALEAFLKQQTPRTPVKKWRRWESALRHGDSSGGPVLLWLESTDLADEGDYEGLLAWVAEGNHAVLPLPNTGRYGDAEEADDAAEDTADEAVDAAMPGTGRADYRDILRDRLGVTVHSAPEVKNPAASAEVRSACEEAEHRRQQAAAAVDGADGAENTERAARLQYCFAGADRIRLPENRTLVWYGGGGAAVFKPGAGSAPLWQGESARGSHIVRLRYGEGTVLLVDSMQAFFAPRWPTDDEYNLNLFDHAYLSAYLAADKSAVWLVRELGSKDEDPPAPAWWRLWQSQPLLMAAALLLMAAIVWHVAVRMGARRLLPPSQVRDLGEHLRARGRFESQPAARGGQLAFMQQQLWHEWQQQWPHWRAMGAEERLNTVCRHRGLPPSAVKMWLEPVPAQPTRKDWLHYVRSHRRLMRAGQG